MSLDLGPQSASPGMKWGVLRASRQWPSSLAGWSAPLRRCAAALGKVARHGVVAVSGHERQQTGRFVIVLSQGRTGSTLILRMLNATAGVRLCGENDRAFDHLRAFADCFDRARSNYHSDFFRLAWLAPCDRTAILAKLRAFALDAYNPGGQYDLVGFKEIRYGRPGTDPDLADDLNFFRELFPSLQVIFSVRRTEDCAKSLWWAADPQASAVTLERIRASFQAYYDGHRDHCYWMPYEELKHGSAVLRGMFDFLGVPFTESAARELDINLRE